MWELAVVGKILTRREHLEALCLLSTSHQCQTQAAGLNKTDAGQTKLWQRAGGQTQREKTSAGKTGRLQQFLKTSNLKSFMIPSFFPDEPCVFIWKVSGWGSVTGVWVVCDEQQMCRHKPRKSRYLYAIKVAFFLMYLAWTWGFQSCVYRAQRRSNHAEINSIKISSSPTHYSTGNTNRKWSLD